MLVLKTFKDDIYDFFLSQGLVISFLYCFLNAEVQSAILVHWDRWKLVRAVGRESSFTQSSFLVNNLGLGSSASVTVTPSQSQVRPSNLRHHFLGIYKNPKRTVIKSHWCKSFWLMIGAFRPILFESRPDEDICTWLLTPDSTSTDGGAFNLNTFSPSLLNSTELTENLWSCSDV